MTVLEPTLQDRSAVTIVESLTAAITRAERALEAAPLPIAQLETGQRFAGRYVVRALVGRGGFGEVYRVVDTRRADAEVALKLHRVAAGERAALEALKDEFALLASLAHPNLAEVFDFGIVEDVGFFTQRLVDGVPFDRCPIRLDSARDVRLVAQLCRALDYLHSRGILHRDIKPSNILVDLEDERLALLDFGISSTLGRVEEAQLVGTVAYLAPEAIAGSQVDARTDLYAVGVALYKLVAGHPPFRGKPTDVLYAHLTATPPPLPEGTHPGVARIIERLLRKEPRDRYASARELVEALSEALGVPVELDTRETLASYVLSARFVGRQAELVQELTDRAARASPGTRPVLVSGEAGTGKSRLVREVRQRVQLAGGAWLQIDTHRADAARDLVHQIGSALLATPELAPRLSEDQRVELARVFPELRRRRERLALSVDPERTRALQLRALGHAVALAFAPKAGAIAIEDLHWAEPEALREIAELVRHARENGARCAVIVTARPGDAADAIGAALGAERIEATELDPDASALLVDSMFGTAILDGTELGEALGREPHPALWVQESLRLAVETGAIVRRHGRWERTSDIGAPALPDLLVARLRQLSETTSRAALAAAVVGRAATLSDLAAVCGKSPRRTAALVRDMVRTGIVEDRRDPRGSVTYAMHDRFVDVIVQSTPSPVLRRAHLRAGRHLARVPRAPWQTLARAAEHFADAQTWRAAAETFAKAADGADAAGRPDLGAALVAQEIAMRKRMSESVLGALLRKHDLETKAGRTADAEATLRALESHRRRATPTERVDVALRVARQRARRGDATAARTAARRTLRDARRLGLARAECELLLLVGEIEVAHGVLERAVEAYRAAGAAARSLGDPALEAEAMYGVALAAIRLGRTDEGHRAAERAVKAARAAGNLVLVAEALRHVGNTLRERGDVRGAASMYRSAVRAARRSGSSESEAKALNNLGSTAHWRGDVEDALDAWRRSIELKDRIGATASALLTYANMGGLLSAVGRHDEARDALERVLAASAQGADAPMGLSLAQSNMGDLCALTSRLDDALVHYGAADRMYAEQGWLQLHTHALTGLVRSLLLVGTREGLDAAPDPLARLEKIVGSLDIAEVRRRWLTTAAMFADARGDAEAAMRFAQSAAREDAIDTVFSDAFGTSIEARWMLAVLHARAGRTAMAERERGRARARLVRRANALERAEQRQVFIERHPMHRAIVSGALTPPPGCTWLLAVP